MSSFIRKTKGASNAPHPPGGAPAQATRPSPNGGPSLVSSGCADLDKILGGGFPLGSLTIFAEDGWTSHHELFLKHFVSEGVATGQPVGIIRHADDHYTNAGEFLLRRMSDLEVMKETETDKAAAALVHNETKLRIAWQYEKYARKPVEGPEASLHTSRPTLGNKLSSLGPRGPWCHDHDISKPPSDKHVQQMLDAANRVMSDGSDLDGRGGGEIRKRFLELYTIGTTAASRTAPSGLQPGVVAQIAATMSSFALELTKWPGTVGRLIIPSLGGVTWNTDAESIADALMFVRSFVQQDPRIAVAVSVPLMGLRPSDAAKIAHVSDAYFCLKAVEDGSPVVMLSTDSQSVSGTMEIMRLPAFGWIRSPLPEVRSYVVRRRRKRLVLEAFEVDPDAEADASGDPALVDW